MDNFYTGCTSNCVRWWKFRVQLCNLEATIVSFVVPVTGFAILVYEPKIPTFLGSVSVNMESSCIHLIVFAVSFVLQGNIFCVVPVSFCIMVGSMCCGTSICMAGYLSCLKKYVGFANTILKIQLAINLASKLLIITASSC